MNPAIHNSPSSALAGAPESPDLASSQREPKPPATAAANAETSAAGPGNPRAAKLTLFDRMEAFVSRLSVRSNFWHRVCSIIWLPYAARSGIRMKRVDENTFSAVLPFTRFNKNWYNAMAGAALLGNSEIAGGMYVFGICGGDYQVVCRHLDYRFLRPCLGPAIYRITPREKIEDLLATRKEFNITLDMEILQQFAGRKKGRDHRVGRCMAEFHVTPKTQAKAREQKRDRDNPAT
ncbi:MAG: hypothetical protein IT435_08935 [Phycisphaerales bacterium]|nr:hypothetical protein [Phycisphaerales bacterium]